ncbi:hypothetical protein FPV67DRAFT_1103146 [Lyophyllum atratum]|nr:hypothetical protein FPV67DRAFT_1103146 [Lyophyllum atratum]
MPALETVAALANIGSFFLSLLPGRCKSRLCEIKANLEIANMNLAEAFDELGEYGKLFEKKDFRAHREGCLLLKERVVRQFNDLAVDTSYLERKKKFAIMLADSALTKAKCINACMSVKDTSAVARTEHHHRSERKLPTNPFADPEQDIENTSPDDPNTAGIFSRTNPQRCSTL